MSVTGICHVCESAAARHTCELCGQAVCRDHWRSTTGVCLACARGTGGEM
ncbi:hypothetical protein [Halorubrum vacuolatum]|uniref:HIT zinc finger n=1 Tax=Halorubrum vacuolatum TaxID=63740 RepID=A0A238V8F3_HALVU|nr:hypothetical protein [Halorubrum vacuolatum]SNR30317.1 hypothetical protein SAMN06264855_10249 [Halorubrum vacuolatum]